VPSEPRPGPCRVLLLIFHVGAAGMEQQLLHLAQGLAERGHAVTVGCFVQSIPVDDVAAAGVRFVTLGDRTRAGRVTALRRIARLARAHDVVHATGWDASLWGRIGGILGGRPVLVTDHSPDRALNTSRSGASRERLIAWHNRLLDPFTAATVAVARHQIPVLESEGVRPQSIELIPNGVPIAGLRAAAHGLTRAELGVPEGARVVVHVARFQPQKRQELTYATVARIRAELGDDVHVLFVGQGGRARREALAAQARADGAGWAHFLGVRRDVPALLALADIAILPSSAEALPMAVIEALAVGTPQVATDVGEVGALLRSTGAGVVVDVDDHDGLAAACRLVLTDDALAAGLRERAHAAAWRFDSAVMVDRYAALIARVLGRPAPAPTAVVDAQAEAVA